MNNSHRNDVASGLFTGALIGLTFGSFVRLIAMAISLPRAAIAIYSDPSQRFHYMYYPAAALTIVALVMVFGLGATGQPGFIFYGLFVGWIAGDLKYYSEKWHGKNGWLSWCPGAGYMKNGQQFYCQERYGVHRDILSFNSIVCRLVDFTGVELN